MGIAHYFDKTNSERLASAHEKIKSALIELSGMGDDRGFSKEEKESFIFFIETIRKYSIHDYCGGKRHSLLNEFLGDPKFMSGMSLLTDRIMKTLTPSELYALENQCVSAAMATSIEPLSDGVNWNLFRNTSVAYWSGYWLSKSILTRPFLKVLSKFSIRRAFRQYPLLCVIFSL